MTPAVELQVVEVWAKLLAVPPAQILGHFAALLRALPFIVLVPSLGLAPLPWPARLGFAAAFTFAMAEPLVVDIQSQPLSVLALELLKGLPIALGTAALLGALGMAGAVMDSLVGLGSGGLDAGGLDAEVKTQGGYPAGPVSALFSLPAVLLFIETGGISKLAAALIAAPVPGATITTGAIRQLLAAIELAIAIATPVLILALVLELCLALMLRSTSVLVGRAFALLRPLAVLAGVALLLDPMFGAYLSRF